jgi:hypothetical protein
LETRHARAEHQDARRRHGTGRRGQHREKLRERVRGDDHGLVAGDVALRREGVHRLGPRHPRDRIHAERGRTFARERAHGIRVGERLDRGDKRGAIAKQRDLVGRRLLHLHHEIRTEDRIAVGDRRAGLAIRLVVVTATGARARFDDDLGPGFGELADRFRHERDPSFAGHGLSRHSDLHLTAKS